MNKWIGKRFLVTSYRKRLEHLKISIVNIYPYMHQCTFYLCNKDTFTCVAFLCVGGGGGVASFKLIVSGKRDSVFSVGKAECNTFGDTDL